MAKKVLILPKNELDSKIKELLRLQEQQDKIGQRINELKTILESQYRLPPRQKEVVEGIKMYMEKIPVDNGRHSYDLEMLSPILKKIRGAFNRCVSYEPVIKTKELYELVKEGKIQEAALDACRVSRWTFRSIFKRIESRTKDAPDNTPTKPTRRRRIIQEDPKKLIRVTK